VLCRLRRIMPVDAAFFATVDPQTGYVQPGVTSADEGGYLALHDRVRHKPTIRRGARESHSVVLTVVDLHPGACPAPEADFCHPETISTCTRTAWMSAMSSGARQDAPRGSPGVRAPGVTAVARLLIADQYPFHERCRAALWAAERAPVTPAPPYGPDVDVTSVLFQHTALQR
jgi:hypothetical protein